MALTEFSSRVFFSFTAPMKYGYSNARVRAMKAHLLNKAILEEMVKVGNVEAMAELLQKTDYKGDFAGAAATISDAKGSRLIEAAGARNFARTVKKLANSAPKGDKKALDSLLMRWDLMNVKTLIQGRRLKRTYEEVRPYLFEAGGLKEEDFRRIMKADENNLVRELKATALGRKMVSAGSFGREMEGGRDSLARMEKAIDSYIYIFMDHALAEIGGKEVAGIRRILKREVDAKNLMIIERLKAHGVAREKILTSLIKGGTLGDATLSRLLEVKDLPSAVAIVKPQFPQLELKSEGKGGIEGRGGLSELEIALEKSIAAQKVAVFHRSILSAGVVIGFLLLKEEELNNLRKIAKGKEFHMAENEVRQMLVVM
jgi:V/A-type H+/Na+-transporting ATPase subunit C